MVPSMAPFIIMMNSERFKNGLISLVDTMVSVWNSMPSVVHLFIAFCFLRGTIYRLMRIIRDIEN